MTGSFTWKLGGEGSTDIEAELIPAPASNQWKAEFRFRFNGSRHKWKGTLAQEPASPSDLPFTNGSVTGEVTSGRGRGKRTWRIQGELQDGNLVAEHAELNRRGAYEPSGELRLRLTE